MSIIAGGPFISEFHYDNAGGDVGEFVEVCFPPGTEGAAPNFQLVLYNGNGGGTYSTINLSNVPAANVCVAADGNTYYNIPTPNIQNGAPDGMALVNDSGVVCEFLSYEGTMTATNGPASGMTSTNVGAVETSSTMSGTSIQLQPDGTWVAGLPETPKQANICFLRGTNILTHDGYKKIESLKAGDSVTIADGTEKFIKWIGIQTVDIKNSRNALLSDPIQISKNSIAEGIPSRDLRVSPNHAVLVDGLLINAGALVNNENIFKTEPTASFKYYHIELDSHELIIAENTWTESYLPQNENRDDFDNAAAFDHMYPEGRKILLWPLSYPRISAQSKVPQYIKDKLLSKIQTKKTA